MQNLLAFTMRKATLALIGSGICLTCCTNKSTLPANLTKKSETHTLKFDFGAGSIATGYKQVLPSTLYTKERGYGIISSTPAEGVIRTGMDALRDDFITSSSPFYFVVDLPEGNYEVRVLLGDSEGQSVTTVKAESRRLMLEKVVTPFGEVEYHTFMVNVRTPRIGQGDSIHLKPREINYLNWDDKLTLEFNHDRPCVVAIEIKPVEDIITVFLAGNSTVVDQEYEPWASWGQMITCFFKPGVVIANYAESGESLKSFIGEKRLKKILSTIKEGDYLFIEFAHNDQKPGASYVEPFTTYKEHLKIFIREARKRGAHPVLVTSMHRRQFDEGGRIINTLGDYPAAMRETAEEENVPCIDLNAMSKVLYEFWGAEQSKKAFVHYPAGTFPGQKDPLKDNTHFSTYGAYEIARCIVAGIQSNKLDLAQYLREDIVHFNPAHPNPMDGWQLPLSPDVTVVKPDGN